MTVAIMYDIFLCTQNLVSHTFLLISKEFHDKVFFTLFSLQGAFQELRDPVT